MAHSQPKLNVFVSSTSEDLKDHRAVARNVILDLGWHPEMMEHFGAASERTIDVLKARLDQCQLVLLIVGFRRGSVPPVEHGGNGSDSFTKLEFDYARARGVPVLALLASDAWPVRLSEAEQEAREWVDRFRAEINQPAGFFDPEHVTSEETERFPSFRAKVREALLKHQANLAARLVAIAISPARLDHHFFATARDGLIAGNDVPFLGTAVCDDGPLSSSALIRALIGEVRPDRRLADAGSDEIGPEEFPSLATAAEYRERFLRSRDLFLKEFGDAISKQTESVDESPIYELLAHLNNLPVIVSNTYDQLLENRFREAGIPFVTVSHILRSANGEHDGKIVVLRDGAEPEICVADRVDVQNAGHVIYKPLGSPLLHDRFDPDLEIDTVVVTETDHLTFLGRLGNQLTQIPSAIIRLLRHHPLLFIGYPLDVWHYRLVMQVFESVGRRAKSPMLAVRKPETTFEEIAWDRLGADLIRMDPAEFAREVVAQLQTH